MGDFRPDQAKLRAAYDEKLAGLAARWHKVNALQGEIDEEMSAIYADEARLSVWREYLDPPPQESLERQVERAMCEEAASA
jgi:hypothetical protein